MARDRVYINSNYWSEIDEMKDRDILGFSLVENKDSFLLAVAMGGESPEAVKSKDGWFLMKNLKTTDKALLAAVLLGAGFGRCICRPFRLLRQKILKKIAHTFRGVAHSVQIRLNLVLQVTVAGLPVDRILLCSGQLLFELTVFHVHHKTVGGLAFQLGKFFFGQRIVAKQGLFAQSGNILCMDKSVFGKSGLFLNSGKRLLLLVGLGGQGI